jgi:hypothetical protein
VKNILLIFRDGYDARYLLYSFITANPGSHYLLVLESGSVARSKKLKKYFSKKSFIEKIISVIDILGLLLLDKIMMWKIISTLGSFDYPKNVEIKKIDDVNNFDFVNIFQDFNPDLIFNYGTAIYTAATLRTINKPIFNIHSGILPFYRNVHSDFWAYMNNDFNNIGITIFILDAGIDAGEIVSKKFTKLNGNKSLSSIKIHNLRNILALMNDFAIRLASNDKFIGIPQNEIFSASYATPKFIDLLRFSLKNLEFFRRN